MSRTNLHIDIGLGWLVHENFFTAAKLRFLAGEASLLDEASTGTQNWSVRAMPTSIQSISVISVISQIFRPFSVIWGQFWQFLAPNSKLSQTSHVTTQNDHKRSRNPMEMDSDVIFRLLGLFFVI